MTTSGSSSPARHTVPSASEPILESGVPMSRQASHDDIVERVRSAWGGVLGVHRIGDRDNFFDLGGDSYKATVAAENLTEELGMSVLRLDIFECPTPLTLVDRITNVIGT